MMSLNEQAYIHLKQMITTNKLSYQEIYSETKLSKQIGISRTPFRDAIHRLVQEGYIDIIPSKGFQLHQLTRQDVEETFQVRSALECYCTVEIAKAYGTVDAQSLFHELDQIMQHMNQIQNSTQDIEQFSAYDFAFHTKIIAYLNNAQFISIFNTFMYRMQKLAALSLAHEGRMQATYIEHLSILKALQAGDVEHIYEITKKHMDTPKGMNLEDL